MLFPMVEQFHPDAYPLELLGLLISDGKSAPLCQTIVEEEQLAPAASAVQSSLERAGTFRFRIRAFPDKQLTRVERAVHAALERFESEGFTDEDLSRIKAQYETGFYNQISSVLNKAFQLATYNEFAGSPGFVTEDLRRYLAVTSDDVWRVYNQYIKDQHSVITSFVPQGQVDRVAEGSKRFAVVEEAIETVGLASAERAAAVANSVFTRLVYGDEHILAHNTLGTADDVESFTVDDLRRFYEANYAPNVSHLTIAGDIGKAEAIELFRPLEQKWAAKEVTVSSYVDPTPAEEPAVYVVDIPQARQSEIRIGHLALPYDHPDYYATSVMNHALGGSFNGRVNLILREEKGDTYGARSSFSGSSYPGTFMASAGVRSNVTLESVQIFKDELEKFREGVADEELAFTQGALIQGNARRFETLGALRAMLGTIGTYSLPFDYIQDQEQVVQDMTLERHQELARMYIRPQQMIYLIVGDAETQVERLEELGLGVPIMLDRNGKESDTKATVE